MANPPHSPQYGHNPPGPQPGQQDWPHPDHPAATAMFPAVGPRDYARQPLPMSPGLLGAFVIILSFAAAGRADASNPLLAHLRHYRPDLFR